MTQYIGPFRKWASGLIDCKVKLTEDGEAMDYSMPPDNPYYAQANALATPVDQETELLYFRRTLAAPHVMVRQVMGAPLHAELHAFVHNGATWAAVVGWNYQQMWSRADSWWEELIANTSLSPVQLDEIFMQAMDIL